MPKKYIASIDALRIFALVAIVIGHVYTNNETLDRLIQSWRLPIFFMLSGYFWSGHRSVGQEASKRWHALLVPYLWWLAIIGMVSLLVRVLIDLSSIRNAVQGVLLGGSDAERPLTTFWFFTALFFSTVIYRALSKFPSWVRLSGVAAGLVANMLAGHELALVPLSAATALGALVFLEAGRALRALQGKFADGVLFAVAVGFLALAAAILLTMEDFIPVDMKSGEFPPAAVGVAILIGGSLMIAATAAPDIPQRVGHVLAKVANGSLAVIILHPFILWMLRPEASSIPLSVVASVAFLIPLGGGSCCPAHGFPKHYWE
ncbi:acyltransferase family protein [Arthrobacter sp. MYb227]|uniref:acyltransferase family protein n=1 Tax=Arthrobacter sp. MYb227 TaxID=1848601 RepID=UPI0021570464|nr:acyltransferase family protein [Arthrobacter sp. MYb227]